MHLLKKNPAWFCLVVATATCIADQLSKVAATRAGLVSVNTGISFGLFGSEHQILSATLFVGLGVIGILALCQYSVKYPVAAGLFFGGAVSNIFDRLIYGGVRDWLPVVVLPVKNNLADWAIFAAVLIFMISELKSSK